MYKRIISLLLVFSFVVLGTLGRIGYISLSKNYTVDKSYNSILLNVDNLYCNYYYSNLTKINNNKKSFVAVIKPNDDCIKELKYIFNDLEIQEILSELKTSKPIIKPTKEYKKLDYIKIYEIYSTENNCNQLINKNSKGLLYYQPNKIGSLNIKYNVDAKGRILYGDDGTIENDNYNSLSGYKLSIDNNIQNITYNACENIDNGCAIVLDINSFDILSMVTKPDKSCLNKAFMYYNPGSVFKILVAMCAIENGIDLEYNCSGSITIGDTTFNCQNEKAHGNQTLKEALANSCNCYFINLALELGYERLLATANKLGFNDSTVIFNDWILNNSKLPTPKDLKSKGELSLFGFGQGKVMVTPLQMANCISIIANGGYKAPVTVVKSRVDDNGKEYNYPRKEFTKVFKEDDCKKMIDYLSYVVSNGTGKKAQSVDLKSAGKTATAQTGQYSNEKELLNTWFVGLYPNDEPKYAIAIMKENGVSGSADCCPIFSTIVENLPK